MAARRFHSGVRTGRTFESTAMASRNIPASVSETEE